MSTPTRDLWPDDIVSEEIVSPEAILDYQADLLRQKTNGRLIGHVEKLTGEDRKVLGFEVESPRRKNRIRLFEVQHRLDFDYPARVFPPQELPDFLKDQVYRPGMVEKLKMPSGWPKGIQGGWEKQEWIASSPVEFSNMIEQILKGGAAKALVLSLLSDASQGDVSNNDTNDS